MSDRPAAMPQTAAAPPILINWTPQSFLGWGIFGINLGLWLNRAGTECVYAAEAAPGRIAVDPIRRLALTPVLQRSAHLQAMLLAQPAGTLSINAPCLHALGNDLIRQSAAVGGKMLQGAPDIGVVFCESGGLSPQGRVNATPFAKIIAGSQWTADMLAAAKLPCPIALVQQGVDTTIFRPGTTTKLLPNRFLVFSGGKLEYRKGQDLVLRAFARFAARRPEALLITAWQSGYAAHQSRLDGMAGMIDPPRAADGRIDVGGWVQANGIGPDQHVDLGLVDHEQFSVLLREVDVALFPNRCESGTNLVAMEAMASGVPVILSDNTGHRDLMDATPTCYRLTRQTAVDDRRVDGVSSAGWGESDAEEIIACLERACTDRAAARALGLSGADFIARFSWDQQAAKFAAAIRSA